MGMYTELVAAVQIKNNIPQNVIETLKYMIGDDNCCLIPPSHELFTTDRWGGMLRSDSYYFDGDTNSALRYDDISKSFYKVVRKAHSFRCGMDST